MSVRSCRKTPARSEFDVVLTLIPRWHSPPPTARRRWSSLPAWVQPTSIEVFGEGGGFTILLVGPPYIDKDPGIGLVPR